MKSSDSPPERPVALVPMMQHFGIRYFILTGMLQKLSGDIDFVLVLGWQDDKLESELRRLGFSWYYMPIFKKNDFYPGRRYSDLLCCGFGFFTGSE